MTTIAFLKPAVFLQGRAATGRQQFTRDQAITVKVNFYDSSGAVANPASATLTIDYKTINDGCIATGSYTLVQSGNDWTYTWDSSIAQRGEISGHVASDDKTYAVDFTFRLTAGFTNRDLAGDDVGNGYCP